MVSITFEEDTTFGYASRTRKNASADATIAIATDFKTGGERLTKQLVLEQRKLYIPIDGHDLSVTKERVDKIVRLLNSVNATTLNIAGNGTYTLKNHYFQSDCDAFVYTLLQEVITHPELKNRIRLIRTGGQTGFDEAGAKAGARLNIPTLVLAPRGWVFRYITGTDVADEQLFKSRFEGIK
jgi:hypothetical protein